MTTMRAVRSVALVAIGSTIAAGQTLDLRFERSLLGQGGETPLAANGVTYGRGAVEWGGVFGDPTGLRYGAAGNILAGEGTLEFWVKPTWAGSDGQGHAFLHWGASGGGMIVLKDGAGNLRGIFNQYGVGGKPEMGVGFGVSSWSAGRWHHVALTWSSAALQTRLYVDGALKSTAALPATLPAIADDSFRVGGGWGGNESRSVLDEIRIYGTARTTAEIQSDYAQDLTLHPSLVLAFENSVVGEDGEIPSTQGALGYTNGAIGRCLSFVSGTQLWYNASGNIRSDEGTVEFWVKPTWNGNDGVDHTFVGWGAGGGILLAKDGSSNLRGIFSRFGTGGTPEMDVAFDVRDWEAGAWHHLAYTWSNSQQKIAVYVDGLLASEETTPHNLPTVTASTFSLGRDVYGTPLIGLMDELRIYPFARTAAQIKDDVGAELLVSSVTIDPPLEFVYPTWRGWPTALGMTQLGPTNILAASAQWSSSDPSVVVFDEPGVPRAVGPGTATISATFMGQTGQATIVVSSPARAAEEVAAQPFLRTPALGAVYEIPVLSIRYVPTPDGVNVDDSISGATGTVADTLAWIDAIEVETKFMLEEGSRFRGYANAAARPSVGYRVVRTLNIFEPLPPDRNRDHRTGTNGLYFPDYLSIATRAGLQHAVESLGVREVWLWGYHHGEIVPVESNMASALTGDISNSNRFPDDLPIFGSTYTLYNYNWTRSSNESVHDHGHQIEALLSHVCQNQDMNTDLFWTRFVGQDGSGTFVTGRCGWTHMPPNTTSDYDYENPAYASSDIFDWKPSGGGLFDVNADSWGSRTYAWPSGVPPAGLTEHNWYVFWMQSIPGLDSGIAHDIGTGAITNWWAFIGDWDAQWPLVDFGFGLHSVDEHPVFTTMPLSQTPCLGETVVLAAGVVGQGVTYRWRVGPDWIGNGPTGNGSEISGAFTPTLTITNFRPEDAVRFVCVATNALGSTESSEAVLGFCAADLNCDDLVEDQDFSIFAGAYNILLCEDPEMPPECPADLNRDGMVDDGDFVIFAAAYDILLCE
jgi:hypothetical protein